MHPLRGPTPDQNGCNAYGSGAMPTDRVHRTTLEYPKEESAAPHTSPVDRNTRSHKNPKHRRCEGRRRDLPRCRWAAAGPGRASRRRAEPPISTPGTTGVEGAGGTCRGAGGRRRGLAGLRDDAPSEARRTDGSRAGRRPLAHTAAGASGARNTRGATTKRGRDRFPGRGLAALNQRYSAEQAPAIRRSCPRGPRPRRGQPRGGQRGRGTGSRTRSRHPRCGRSGSTAGRHRAHHTRRA